MGKDESSFEEERSSKKSFEVDQVVFVQAFSEGKESLMISYSVVAQGKESSLKELFS